MPLPQRTLRLLETMHADALRAIRESDGAISELPDLAEMLDICDATIASEEIAAAERYWIIASKGGR